MSIKRRVDYIEQDRGYGTPCWIWQRCVTVNGYGTFRRGNNGPQKLAHRDYYEKVKGPIPEGLVIDHLCRVQVCVNPEHLEAVTLKENILRGEGMGAKYARRTHCAKGHPFSGDNLIPSPPSRPGARGCRTCERERSRRRKKAA